MKPHYVAYTIREGKEKEDKGYWLDIGAAWPTKDGKGFILQLDALPVNGRVVLREPKPKEAPEE